MDMDILGKKKRGEKKSGINGGPKYEIVLIFFATSFLNHQLEFWIN